MYCPRCGRLACDDVSFCSSCGLPLDAAAALVASGGRLAPRDDPRDDAGALTPRQRGTRKGLLIMAGGAVFLALAFFLMHVKEDFFVLLFLAALVLTFGVMRALYGLLLEDDGARMKDSKRRAAPAEAPASLAGARTVALPHARTRPASDFAGKSADTADMAAPPSVAEATTRLLEEDA
ncbi:MAG TPA: hypothetical protein VM936_01615 [Pyrinomonadaceae bacterium]|jgi:hypothetical protein|nr:hypothetical protein [Pyrinomonadaceae bacterium]